MRRKRKRRPVARKPELSIDQVVAWADAYHARSGRWPGQKSGRIPGSLGENWGAVNNALHMGLRGLPKGLSITRVLAEHRGVRNPKDLPPLSVPQVLAWADAYHARTGQWPQKDYGHISEAPAETWLAVDKALQQGKRGLPPDLSL